MKAEFSRIVLTKASDMNARRMYSEDSRMRSVAVRFSSALICLLMTMGSFGVLNGVALDSFSEKEEGSARSESGADWISPDLEDDVHIVEISRGSDTRSFHAAVGSRNELQTFSEDHLPEGEPIESLDLELGGLMIDDSFYGERIEWNSVDISIEPLRVVAGLTNSEVRLFDLELNDLWSSPGECGAGEVRAVALTPSAHLVFAGSSSGPNNKPRLCAFHGSGGKIFEGDISAPSNGYFVTDIDISENGKFIAVTLAGPSSIVVMYNYADIKGPENVVRLHFSDTEETIQQGEEYAYEFEVFNEGSVTEKVVLSRSIPLSDLTAEFEMDGETSRFREWLGFLSPGESIHGYFWVSSTPLTPVDDYYITVYANAYGDPLKPVGQDSMVTKTTVASLLRGASSNSVPMAYIDSISPLISLVGESVNFSGHGEDYDGLIVSYRWISDLDGVLSYGPANDSFETIDLSVGAHTIYFEIQDDDDAWSRFAEASIIVKSSPTPFPTEIFQEENTDFTAGIAEISRDGRVVSIGSLYWTKLTWNIETVDSAGEVGFHTSIALDSDNNPHISYWHIGDGDLKYTKWTGSTWSTETVDSSGNVGAFTSIALDEDDKPRISYSDETNKDLRYAKWTGSTWNIETVDWAGSVGQYTSIALDGNDYPRISYLDKDNWHLKYAKWTGSTWNIETVDDAWAVGQYTSIALDGNDYPHISYQNWDLGDLKYAKWDGSGWNIETVDSAGIVGHTSIALDSSDDPHISYYDRAPDDLKYAKWTGSTWNIETVDWAGYVGTHNSIALDRNDYPHISYYDESNGHLKYARWTGSDWNIETVDSDFRVGQHTAIALDRDGYPHISYYQWTKRDLKYARLKEWTGTKMTKISTYHTNTDDWSNFVKWTHDSFANEPEITTISLSEWGSFIFVGTYRRTSVEVAEVFVFDKESGGIVETWELLDSRIWSSDFDGVLFGYIGLESGKLVLGTNGDGDSYTVYYYNWDAWGSHSHVYWRDIAGEDVAAVGIATNMRVTPTEQIAGAVFAGDRWGATKHVYCYLIPPPN